MFKKESFSSEEILNWGLGAKIKKEIIVDFLIKDIPEPNEDQKIYLNKNWLEEMNFANKNELDNWLKSMGIIKKVLINL